MDEARQVREFWFGTGRLNAESVRQRFTMWFGGGAEHVRQTLDEDIRRRFGTLLGRAERGELDSWADGPRRRLSLILLLDQFTRNIHRGTSRAFENDAAALALAMSGMQSGADAALDPVERMFFYMPLQHSESLDAQDESVAAYRRLLSEATEDLQRTFESSLDYAEKHCEIIRRFGRCPHRNAALGRANTPEETAFLASGAERFGQ